VLKGALYDLHSRVPNGIEVERRVAGEVRVKGLEAKSSETRVTPSPGVQQCSNGILGRGARRSSRINKEGREHRGRDSPKHSSKGLAMLVAGIDVGAEVHHVAVVDQSEAMVTKPTVFEESAPGYEKLLALLG
jgi:hypothetical protein